MIYNFNLGIGWASSGVEYAQSYRANMLRGAGLPAKFIFTDMFPRDNIEHMTENIGFYDEEIIWLYTAFCDTKIAPVSYTLDDLIKSLGGRPHTIKREKGVIRLTFSDEENSFYTAYTTKDDNDLVHRVEMVSNGRLIRKDYFTYTRIYSEYYAPLDKHAHLYQRRFFNDDGSVAYEEIIDDDDVMYKFPDKVLYSKEELIGYMVKRLRLTERDIVIIDRTTGVGQVILENVAPAKVGIVIHADHFSEGATDDRNILWNNYYEYAFAQSEHIDFYVCATEDQRVLLKEQFMKYYKKDPTVFTIPVGSLDELKRPAEPRRKHSVITASRLATEKHVDWMIEAVVQARELVPDITLDIYGKGGEENKLRDLIKEKGALGYIRLMGQHDLADVYTGYETYLSASQSEGFGLTLMEAVGSGLPIIGFDVRYGNQNFIDDGENGYCIKINDRMSIQDKIKLLTDCLVKLFTEDDIEAMHEHSYKKAQEYLTAEVMNRWKNLADQII